MKNNGLLVLAALFLFARGGKKTATNTSSTMRSKPTEEKKAAQGLAHTQASAAAAAAAAQAKAEAEARAAREKTIQTGLTSGFDFLGKTMEQVIKKIK